jgi:hypothetical protein
MKIANANPRQATEELAANWKGQSAMLNVGDIEFEDNKLDKPANGKNRRFMWHEQVIQDPLLIPTAYRYAGLVMHDYCLSHNGYSEISVRKAAKRLGVAPSAIQDALTSLIARSWLKRVEGTGQHTSQSEIAFAHQPPNGGQRCTS